MTEITAASLQAIMPQAGGRLWKFVEPLNHACYKFNIDGNGYRIAAFIAQLAHESGQFRYVREIWGPTAAQSRYEGRTDLGNTEPGDGRKFMGRGLIQITGRANYQTLSDYFNEDFMTFPQLLEEPEWACLSAGWFWDSRKLNVLADKRDFEKITKRINGGLNGYDDRLKFYEAALKEFTT